MDRLDERDILDRVGELVAEERALRERSLGSGLAEDQQRRLRDLEVQLDQCWDLMRQRRARSEYGANPDAARLRPPEEVENYWE